MVEFGTEVEIDDNQRKEIFVSVQYYVFSEEDKQAYMVQFTEEEKMVWLRGVERAATKLMRYDIPAEARFFSRGMYSVQWWKTKNTKRTWVFAKHPTNA